MKARLIDIKDQFFDNPMTTIAASLFAAIIVVLVFSELGKPPSGNIQVTPIVEDQSDTPLHIMKAGAHAVGKEYQAVIFIKGTPSSKPKALKCY